VTYVDDVAAHLRGLPRTTRRAALSDLRDLLAEGVTPAELGPAEEYAAALRAALAAGADATSGSSRAHRPQGHVFGLPVDVRGATHAEVRSRAFDPSDPRVLVPRIMGAGWRLNYGAVAVRLGLIRPDDVDDEVLAAIPRHVRTAGRAIPVITFAKTAFWVAAAWRSGTRVPSSWDVAGRVSAWTDRRAGLLPLLAIAGGAAWWGTRTAGLTQEDRLVRNALAASAGATTTAIAVLTTRTMRAPHSAHPEAALIAVVPVATAATMLICPVRAGLRALGARGGRTAPRKDPR